MSYWTIALAVAAFALPLAERFYTRFYPEPETQKRHLKTAARWIIDCACVGFQFWNPFKIAHEPMPTTTKGLIGVAVIASLAIGLPLFLINLRLCTFLINRLLDLQGGHLDTSKQMNGIVSDLIDVSKSHEKVIWLIAASTLSPEAKDVVSKILKGD